MIDEIVAFPLDLKEDCEDQDCSGGRPRHASSSSDGTVESVEDNIIDEVTAEDLDIEKKSTKNNGNGQAAAIQSPKDTFYFYQSSDGKYMKVMKLKLFTILLFEAMTSFFEREH